MRTRRSDAGFTLIEMLLVLVILGVLGTIVIFASGVFTSRTKDAACKANAKILNIAETAYTAQHPDEYALGDMSKLAPYFNAPVPTDGAGAVAWDASSSHWVCADT